MRSSDTGPGRLDCARLLIDYSPAGTDAEIQALPTARLFKLSAFGWEGRNAIGFFRSAWSVESEGVHGKHSYLAFKSCVFSSFSYSDGLLECRASCVHLLQ